MASVTDSARARLISAPFVIVTAATLAFFVFVGIAVSTLPRFIEDELGGDGLAIGINLAVFSIAAIAARPMIARIGDRYGRRFLMVGGALLAGAAIATTAFVHSLTTLLPLRAISGVGEAALFVGAATLIADLSPSERRAEGASYFSLAVFGGLGIGPVVGEVVLGNDRYRTVYLVASLFCVAAALIALAAPNRVAGVVTAPVDGGEARGFHRAAFLPGLVLACGIGGFAAFNAFLPTHAEALGMPASVPFLVYSVLCLSLRVVGARLPERLGLGNALMAALVGISGGLLLLALLDHPSGVYLGTAVLAFGMALLYPSLMAFAVNSVTEPERARVLASFTMFFEVGTVIGGLLLGSVARFGGEQGSVRGRRHPGRERHLGPAPAPPAGGPGASGTGRDHVPPARGRSGRRRVAAAATARRPAGPSGRRVVPPRRSWAPSPSVRSAPRSVAPRGDSGAVPPRTAPPTGGGTPRPVTMPLVAAAGGTAVARITRQTTDGGTMRGGGIECRTSSTPRSDRSSPV